MAQFTEEQLQELETIFDLERSAVLPVKDGVVRSETKVWWLSDGGPERVSAEDHWGNITSYPEYYQLATPKYRVTYEEE